MITIIGRAHENQLISVVALGRTRWLRERQKDPFHLLARKEGYRSRAAYKLLQAVRKHRFIRPGDVVVDLGASPGGWMQASRTIVGEAGFVLGVDKRPVRLLPWKNVGVLLADVNDTDIVRKIDDLLPRKPDAVISDASPDITGIWEVDHARQIDLAEAALRIGERLLRPGGVFFTKVFEGDLLKPFVVELKGKFGEVRLVKPKASRKRSSELYILAKGLT